MNHDFNVGNTLIINSDIRLVSRIGYIRNNARSSLKDFLKKSLRTVYTQTLPINHRVSASFESTFTDYHDNASLEKDTLVFNTRYTIPLKRVDHFFNLTFDKRKFPVIGSNGFDEILFEYKKTIKPDMHTGLKKHRARLNYLMGNSAVKDYVYSSWEYSSESSQNNGKRYFIQNTFTGKFWKNSKSWLPVYQHYVDEHVQTGIIIQQPSGGMVKAGPLIGTRQTIDPHARHNTNTYDNPLYKNPWSNVYYGLNAQTDIQIDPSSHLKFWLRYKNFLNYNQHTGTEFINIDINFSYQLAPRIKTIAEIVYAQNINDLTNARVDNTIFNIIFKLEYLFDLVL